MKGLQSPANLVCYGYAMVTPRLFSTVLIQLNTMAFIKFLAFPMRCLFKGGLYLEITFFKSLTTVIDHSRKYHGIP